MRYWPQSTADEVREAFDFLVDLHGYRLIVCSTGMGGTVAYRSELLWISLEWDRSAPWLEVAPSRSGIQAFGQATLAWLLSGADFDQFRGESARFASLEELATFVRENLHATEALFRGPQRDISLARLAVLRGDRAPRLRA